MRKLAAALGLPARLTAAPVTGVVHPKSGVGRSTYSFTVYKAVLLRRGVITSSRTRVPGAGQLDAENQRELDLLLSDLEPLFTVT